MGFVKLVGAPRFDDAVSRAQASAELYNRFDSNLDPSFDISKRV